tara:strand:+ start:970 stop:1122 length:153 start_codon:yes stop_codon:yes gene_type:complete
MLVRRADRDPAIDDTIKKPFHGCNFLSYICLHRVGMVQILKRDIDGKIIY